MSYKVEPIALNSALEGPRPYVVTVNDVTLLDKRGNPRRFKNSITAAIAGTEEVARRKAADAARRADNGEAK